MRSQFCQLTSALFASLCLVALCLVAMAVGLLAFASTALASDPIDPGVVLPPAKCGGCPDTANCPGGPCSSTAKTSTCANGTKRCEQCLCLSSGVLECDCF